MVTNKNCSLETGSSPAQAATPQPLTGTQSFINDWLTDLDNIQAVRRHLRTWFLTNVPDWDGNFGQNLEIQILHYEVLDELLSNMIQDASKQPIK